jgi:hypothetical protein
MIGEDFTVIGTERMRNLTKILVNGFNVELVEHPDVITQGFGTFKGYAYYTTDLYVRNISEAQFVDIEMVASEIAELLSFATSSPVRKFGYDFGNKGLKTGVMGQIEYFRPAIDALRGDLIRSFLEKTWAKYHILRTRRNIKLAFSYYVLSQQSEQPMELLLVASFVLLENLKHHFALDKGYPFIRGFFRLAGATLARPGPKKSFEQLLTEMLQEVGISPFLTPIIELRNDLIHSGLSVKPFSEQTAIYEACQDIIREYILKLLGYTGEYCRFSTPNITSII